MLSTSHISYQVGNKQILSDISASFWPGSFNMILGPNGSGKSTFLKIFSGTIHHFEGSVHYGDIKVAPKELTTLSRFRAVLGQQPDLSFPMTVEEVVMMGRYPHFRVAPTPKDIAICGEVIERMNLGDFRERNYLTLSGGEKQRVQFARVLAQIWEKPAKGSYRYLFLDEPLNNLDINYQQEFLQIAKSFLCEDTVIVAIIHDINLAIQYADQVFFLKEGRLAVKGAPQEVITENLLLDIFNVRMTLIDNPVGGYPVLVYR